MLMDVEFTKFFCRQVTEVRLQIVIFTTIVTMILWVGSTSETFWFRIVVKCVRCCPLDIREQ